MSVGLRNWRIDLIRGASILMVLFHHFNIAYPLNHTALARAFGWQAIHSIARNGNYGVTMFSVVSGFLITSNARQRWGQLGRVDARNFYSLRAARILPCLLLLLFAVDACEYRGTPSIKRYVMLEQHCIAATVFARVSDDWLGQIVLDNAALEMPEIGITIPLAELYDGIDLTSADLAEHETG